MKLFLIFVLFSTFLLGREVFAEEKGKLERYLLKEESSAPKGKEIAFEKNKHNAIAVDLFDVVLQALSTNYKILASQEKLYQAKRNIDKAYGDYLPSIDVSYTLAKTEKRPGEKKPDQTFKKAKYFGDERYTLSLSQNLYAGGDTENNIHRLKAKYMVARADFERLLEEEAAKAVSSYIDVVFRREALEANKKNMEKLEEIFSIVRAKYDSGALAIGELGSIEASVSNAKSLLSRTNSRYSNALEYYHFITNREFEHTHPYEKITDLPVGDYETIVEDALANNTQLKGFNYNILAQKYLLKKTRSTFRPRVDLQLFAEKITDKENYEFDEKNYMAQLSVNYNLYSGGKDENEYLRIFSTIQELEYEKEAEIRKIKYDIEKLHTSLTSHLQNIDNIKNEVQSSQKMVDAYWEGFRLGEQDLHVLLQGQRQLNSAELDFIENQQNSMQDFFTILKISGKILDYFHIDADHENFLDMARAHYRPFHHPQKTVATLSDFKATHEAPVAQETSDETVNKTEEMGGKPTVPLSVLATLLEFQKDFLAQPREKYTLILPLQSSITSALEEALNLGVIDNFFIYDVFSNTAIRTGIAYGVFDTQGEALEMTQELNATTPLEVVQLGVVHDNAKALETLSLIEQKHLDELYAAFIKSRQVPPFRTDPHFKERFLGAPAEYFTINLGTLPSLKAAEEMLKKIALTQESFVLQAQLQTSFHKVVYGIFSSYEEAKTALEELKALEGAYFPIIERIGLTQNLYNTSVEQ